MGATSQREFLVSPWLGTDHLCSWRNPGEASYCGDFSEGKSYHGNRFGRIFPIVQPPFLPASIETWIFGDNSRTKLQPSPVVVISP